MELCTTQSISHLPKVFTGNLTFLRSNTSLALRQVRIPRSIHGGSFHSRFISVPRAIDETFGGVSRFATEERDSPVTVEVESPIEKSVYSETRETEPPKEESPVDEQGNGGFLSDLNVKFDSEDTYSILLFGGGAVVALWLAAAVVGAIDSIPLFPKLLEIVGLGYTFWFTSRYLLFKENRDELAAKVKDLKQQVLGSNGD